MASVGHKFNLKNRNSKWKFLFTIGLKDLLFLYFYHKSEKSFNLTFLPDATRINFSLNKIQQLFYPPILPIARILVFCLQERVKQIFNKSSVVYIKVIRQKSPPPPLKILEIVPCCFAGLFLSYIKQGNKKGYFPSFFNFFLLFSPLFPFLFLILFQKFSRGGGES